MNAFDITRTSITYNSKLRIILLAEGGSYQGGAFQGFISSNEHFQIIGLPFGGEYVDKLRYSAFENQAYDFSIKQLSKLTGKDFSSNSWEEIEEEINSADLYINDYRGKKKFVSLMVVHEDVYQLLMNESIDTVAIYDRNDKYDGKSDKGINRVKSFVRKTLSPILENEIQEGLLKHFEEEISALENPTQEEVDKIKDMYIRMSRYESLNLGFLVQGNSQDIGELIKYFGNDKAVDIISELYLFNEVCIQTGNYFMPHTCCNETISNGDLSKFNEKLAKLQLEIEVANYEEKIPYEMNNYNTYKKSVLLEHTQHWGIDQEKLIEEMEEMAKKGIFTLEINSESSNTLIKLISENYYGEKSTLILMSLD
jgi:hypothetical protein